jgi:hypothetical protein
MKLVIMLTTLVLLFTCACKLETAANPNANANANANARASSSIESNTTSAEPSQSNCSLTRAAAPVLNELKLGMTRDEVLALFTGSKDDAEVKSNLARPPGAQGESELIIRPANFGSKEKFPGISHINFSFLDGRVVSFNIGYSGPQYSHVDEFVKKFVAGTNLPAAEQWTGYPGLDTQLKTLTCKDFEVRVFAGGEGGNQNYVLISDLEAKKTLKERRAKARTQATPTP